MLKKMCKYRMVWSAFSLYLSFVILETENTSYQKYYKQNKIWLFLFPEKKQLKLIISTARQFQSRLCGTKIFCLWIIWQYIVKLWFWTWVFILDFEHFGIQMILETCTVYLLVLYWSIVLINSLKVIRCRGTLSFRFWNVYSTHSFVLLLI